MKGSAGPRFWVLLLLMGWMPGWAWAEALQAPPPNPAPAVIESGTVSRAVSATVTQQGGGVRFTVDGLAFDAVTAWTWEGMDIAGALGTALADGTAALADTPAGFEVVWKDPPAALRLDEAGRLDLEAAAEGLRVTAAAPIRCPVSVSFGAATDPPLAANARCRYGSTRCLTPTRRHTGIDFSGTGHAIAIAVGTVARVETLSARDHGMGNNVILRHVLPGPNCAVVYSTYSQLASIDPAMVAGAPVVKGQPLGVIGGSGFGNPQYYERHLHLEMKSRAVTGNPFGVGTQTATGCKTNPLNAKAETCWAYVATPASPPDAPDDYGYLDPAGYLKKTLTLPVYRQVSAGEYHTCALKADNTLACWGSNHYGQATPPAGAFQQVSAGYLHTCALKADNTLACWGDNEYGQATPPAGAYQQVSAGGWHTCALKANNTLACWGENGDGRATPPAGAFQQVSAGGYHTCALKANNTLACWGENVSGQATPPAGAYQQVSAGYSHTCALKRNNTLACWGYNRDGQATPPAGGFKQVSAGAGVAEESYSCGIRTDGFIACWGGLVR